ncbi:unnamed protein product [Pieris brassicae]|uniref:C2H2-type domain-containing protein n=1 Tax=Pieris brassicae TaxID=7116 RepID=A0A9P0TTB8_PIEBR|nr:unnamed protein product [Pieris brassicae]
MKEILLHSNATPIRSKGGTGYTCCFCTKLYEDPKDLKKHTIEDHDQETKSNFMKGKDMHGYFVKLDITDLQCKCGEYLDTLEKLLDHLKRVHSPRFFTDIENHIFPFKFSDKTLRCCVCLNIFNTFKAMQEHMNVHYRNYICEVCNAGFVNKNILSRHCDAHKTGTFTCEECSKTFDTARKRLLHIRGKHSGIKLPHKCGYCNERFKEVLKKHDHIAKVHGVLGTEIHCQACDKNFRSKRAWRLHTTRIHLMQRPHKCKHCDMEFYTKQELESHTVKHTGSRSFQCEVCLKYFGRQKTMKEHMRRLHSQ